MEGGYYRRTFQSDSLLHERREAQQHNQTLQQDLQALRLKAEQERVEQGSYVRGVEDRVHREVDRAREEGKAMATLLKEAGRHEGLLTQSCRSAPAEIG